MTLMKRKYSNKTTHDEEHEATNCTITFIDILLI